MLNLQCGKDPLLTEFISIVLRKWLHLENSDSTLHISDHLWSQNQQHSTARSNGWVTTFTTSIGVNLVPALPGEPLYVHLSMYTPHTLLQTSASIVLQTPSTLWGCLWWHPLWIVPAGATTVAMALTSLLMATYIEQRLTRIPMQPQHSTFGFSKHLS